MSRYDLIHNGAGDTGLMLTQPGGYKMAFKVKQSMKRLYFVLFVLLMMSGLGLHSQTPVEPSGDGDTNNPYQINTLENLYWIAADASRWNKHYIQTADIDASETSGWFGGAGWSPIGNSANKFTGTYDGQGHTISGLTINRPGTERIGLFGHVLSIAGAWPNPGQSAVVSNLGLIDVNITGGSNTGGLAGYIEGAWNAGSKILQCYVTGMITGGGNTGGLVGYTAHQSFIENSYTGCEIISNGWGSGGISGAQWGTAGEIVNCYSSSVFGGTGGGKGGLVGQGNNSVKNSFWDTQISNISSSAGGTGKTTAEMKTQSTFTDAGWNFIGIWDMDGDTNDGYPFLSGRLVVIYDDSGSWTAPPDVFEVIIEAWGGGGGGAEIGPGGGGGGGGGAYARSTISVTPGTTYTINIGTGGAGDDPGGNGGATWFDSSETLMAPGGSGGNGTSGGAGGDESDAFGDVRYSGGGGGTGVGGGAAFNRGAGGGGGSPTRNGMVTDGQPGTNKSGGDGGLGEATGGTGGRGGVAGTDGGIPGAGGGGNGNSSTAGNGAHGRIIIIYLPPAESDTYYSLQSGNWNNASSWSTTSHTGAAANSAPGPEDTVIIGNGDAITLTTAVTNNASVSVNNTGTLITGNNILSGSGSFTLSGGATLHIGSPGGITLSGTAGNIQNTGSRSFNPGAGYVYNGTSAQSTGNGLPATVNNLTINNGNGVTALGDLAVSGSLTLTTGTLIMPAGSSLVTSNVAGTGNVRMQHAISGSKGWRMVASPVGTTYGDLFGGFVTQGYTGSSFPALQPNIIWFDETELGTTNMAWRTPSNATNNVPGGRGHFQFVFDGAGQPDGGGSYPDVLPITMTATGREHMTGSSFNFDITHTPRSEDDITDTDIPEMNTGWNLVGNPTTASLGWDASGWTKTRMDDTYYIWVAGANGGAGEYQAYNALISDIEDPDYVPPLSGGGTIAPFQAFWVRANDASPVFSMTHAVKATGGSFVQKDGGAFTGSSGLNSIILPVRLHADTLETTSYIAFSETGKIGEDIHDAYRLEPMNDTWLKLYTTTTKHNDPLVINNLPSGLEEQIRIPLYVGGQIEKQPLSGSYTLRWSVPHRWPEDWGVALMDHHQQKAVSMVEYKTYQFDHQSIKTTPDNQIPFRAAGQGESAPLTEAGARQSAPLTEAGQGESAQFTIPNQVVALLDNPVAKTSQDPNRFTIVITPGGAGEDPIYTPDTPALLPPYPNPARHTIHIEFNLPDNDRVIIEAFDLQGRRVATLADEQFTAGYHKLAPWTHPMLSDGIYLITLTTSSHKDHQKMTIIR